MDQEKKRVLDMLADGTITADEAGMLIDQLGEAQPDTRAVAPDNGDERMLRVRVIAFEEGATQPTNVEINLPLKVARIAGRIITTMMPEQARRTMREEGIDLSGIDFNELIDALADTGGDIVNVSHQGEKEQATVRVYVG